MALALAGLLAAALGPLAAPGPARAAGTPIITLVAQPGTFSQPVFVTNDGSSSRLFVAERTGRIYLIKNGAKLTVPFLDVAAHGSNFSAAGGEQGLLGLAFDPAFATNRRLYVAYTRSDLSLQVSLYTVPAASSDTANTAETSIINVPHPGHSNHNGGMIAFGPDGHLWIGTGDGGGANDPGPGCGNAQNKASLLGKLLRIDPRSTGGHTNPTDNPFFGATAGADEVWAFGLRNPWRWSFDRVTGALWIGDVGQAQVEEVDRALAPNRGRGGNFGWPYWEGTYQAINGCPAPAAPIFPLTEYGHGAGNSIGCAIVGGYVYRGSQFPNLQGRYLFSDNCSGTIWDVTAGAAQPAFPNVVAPQVLLDTSLSVSSFGEGRDGELYLTDLAGGRVYRVTSNVQRVFGADRYATSAAIAGFGGYAAGGTAYIATGTNFPDALSAAPLAGRDGDPLLLVRPDVPLPSPVANRLAALRPSKIVILGSTGSVSSAVQSVLATYLAPGGTIVRYGGADRYATSAAIVHPPSGPPTYSPPVGGVLIATGANFPDALSGGPAAGSRGWPLLLVRPDAIPAPVASALAYLRPQSIFVLGSTASVSQAVEQQLVGTYLGGDGSKLRRFSGSDRYDTSARINQWFFHNSGSLPAPIPDNSALPRPDPGYIATGANFPDALSGAALAARDNAPLLLVAPTAVPGPIAAELGQLRPRSLVIFGGPSVVSDATGAALGGYCVP